MLAIRATPVGSGSLSSLGVPAGLPDEPTGAGGPGGGPAQRDDELAANYRTPAACDDFDEERAAIIEFDGGVPRPWAEAFARLEPRRGVQQASCAAQLEPDRREERPPGRERRADGSADLNTTFLLPWHRRQAAGPQPTADLRLRQIKVLEPQRSYSAGQIARRVTA